MESLDNLEKDLEVKLSGYQGEQPPYRAIPDKESVCLVGAPNDETQCAEPQILGCVECI